MLDSSKAYEAKIINKKVQNKISNSNKRLATLDEIIEYILITNKNLEFKKEEIDERVSKIIRLPIDNFLYAAISTSLKNLEKNDIIEHTKHGYWKKK